jgi:hypothetical protein
MNSELVSKPTTANLILRRLAEALENMGFKNLDAELTRLCEKKGELAHLLAWQFLRTAFTIVDEFEAQTDQQKRVGIADLSNFGTDKFFLWSQDAHKKQHLLNKLTGQGYDGIISGSNCALLKPARQMSGTEAQETLELIDCIGVVGFVDMIHYAKNERWSEDITGCPDQVTLVCLDVRLTGQPTGMQELIPIVDLKKGLAPEFRWHEANRVLPEGSLIVSMLADSWTTWASGKPPRQQPKH